MATLKEWKRDFKRLPKWQKVGLILSILGLLGVGGSLVIKNFIINNTNSQTLIENSNLSHNQLCTGQNCVQIQNFGTSLEGISIYPNPKTIKCNGWDSPYTLKVVNNDNKPWYDVVIRIVYDSKLKDPEDLDIDGPFGPGYITFNQCDENLCYRQVNVGEINPLETKSYDVYVSTKRCSGTINITAELLTKSNNPDTFHISAYNLTDCDQATFLWAEQKFKEKDYTQAIIFYKKTLNISESKPMGTCVYAMIGLFDTYALLGNFSESKYWVDKIPLEVFEQDWKLAEIKGDIYLRNNLFNDAIPIYELVFPFFNYSKTNETLMRVIKKYCACKERAGMLQDGNCYVSYYSIFVSPDDLKGLSVITR